MADAPLRIAQTSADDPDALHHIAADLQDGPFALICLFLSPSTRDLALPAELAKTYPDTEIIGCKTGGELGGAGYETDQIIAIGFTESYFQSTVLEIDDLDNIPENELVRDIHDIRLRNMPQGIDRKNEFAFLLADGLSAKEDCLVSILGSALGSLALFGGSSGDGLEFKSTYLFRNGNFIQNGALLAVMRSRCPVHVFSLDNLVPSDTRMVVTKASPDLRIVHEINAEPAGLEYARLLGLDPDLLNRFTFTSHPVVVRVGDKHHVRAIQQVDDNGDLHFFSAIDVGMVLSLATQLDLPAHLQKGLQDLCQPVPPVAILGCDCVLRRMAADQMQQTKAVSDVLKSFNVIGFSTYGEQIGGLHINQTLTGVAIYPPNGS